MPWGARVGAGVGGQTSFRTGQGRAGMLFSPLSQSEGKEPLPLPTLVLEGAALTTNEQVHQVLMNRCAGYRWTGASPSHEQVHWVGRITNQFTKTHSYSRV